jgi:acetyltransferase-like isoleucine patch superfamily enzyme
LVAYLWKHRAKRKPLSREWLVMWAKRVMLLYAVARVATIGRRLKQRGARIGALTVVGPARLTGKLSLFSIGEHSVVGGATIALHDQVIIGSRVVINDQVTVLTASHLTHSVGWETKCASVTIDDYAWIAYGAAIMPGVRIGRGAVVGAFSVVREDVPAYDIVIGNPAVSRGKRPEDLNYDPIQNLAFVRAWLA